MATSTKKLHDEVRQEYLAKVSQFFADNDEEVLVTGSNEITLPVVDAEGNECYVNIVVKIPTGSRDGDAYDGYEMAEDYKLHCEEQEAKAKEKAEAKAKKIARDKALREEKARLKAEKANK